MKISHYLIITAPAKKYGNPSVKLVKTLNGTMPQNSVAINLNLVLPDSLFTKPKLTATIKIDEKDVSKTEITANVIESIKETLLLHNNISMDIQLIEPTIKTNGEFT